MDTDVKVFWGFVAATIAVLLAPFIFLMTPGGSFSTIPLPHITPRVMDASLVQYAPMWEEEVRRRFPDAVIVMTHGGSFVADRWIILTAASDPDVPCTDVYDVIHSVQARYPGRTVVLLACNPIDYKLTGLPNVYYSPASVWCVPDRALLELPDEDARIARTLDGQTLANEDRFAQSPDVVGNIFEFNEAR